ncbi:hypothetical protein F5972_00580 [Microbispora cellulosiformans]|uniref:Uncharacterized protein n=1 Tax=Microbispora cellulosiformans TaxID=2614688 RepID=A0A5J5K8R7_9ACTN|nr:hypothetical protein [Microbispora cellulosiformans]KAA9381381.1 hypothetical protein F5972_00580 [Microbispora cellulosiformans]
MDGVGLAARELRDHEGACQSRHAFRIDNLDGDGGPSRALNQVIELLQHRFGSADPAAQHAFVDEGQVSRGFVPIEDPLPLHTSFDMLLHLFATDLPSSAEQMPGVRLGLEEAGDQEGVPGTEDAGGGLGGCTVDPG